MDDYIDFIKPKEQIYKEIISYFKNYNKLYIKNQLDFFI